jgi:hypothetical protein
MLKEHSNATYLTKTPVLFLVFNRPDMTQQVFNQIRNTKPSRLYVAADGPRLNKSGEAEKVKQVRELIQSGVDWDCEVKTLFREQNLGCRRAVSNAITWFFEQEEEGIILEDDCLPHPTFFRFCTELLHKYRSDSRMMMISGNNFQFGQRRTRYSYYYSRYSHIWGWATWRRAWEFYDVNMKSWPEIEEGQWLEDILRGDETAIWFWREKFNAVQKGEIDSWAYIWLLSIWMQNGLSITPNYNLVSNIGFGTEATHTRTEKQTMANMAIQPISFPLEHPPFVIRDSKLDGVTERWIFKHTSLQRFVKRVFPHTTSLKQLFIRS